MTQTPTSQICSQPVDLKFGVLEPAIVNHINSRALASGQGKA